MQENDVQITLQRAIENSPVLKPKLFLITEISLFIEILIHPFRF